MKVASVYVGNFLRRYAKFRFLLPALAAVLGLSMKPSTGEMEEIGDVTTLDLDAGDVLGGNADALLDGADFPEVPDFDVADLVILENVTGADLLSDLDAVQAGGDRDFVEQYLLDHGYTKEQIDAGLRVPEPSEYDPANTMLVQQANLPPLDPNFDPANAKLWEIQKRIVDLEIWRDWHEGRSFEEAGRENWDSVEDHTLEAERLENERWQLQNDADRIIRGQRGQRDTGEEPTGDEPSEFRVWEEVGKWLGGLVEGVRRGIQAPPKYTPEILILGGGLLLALIALRRKRRTA